MTSMTSHGSRCERNTFPAWRSVESRTWSFVGPSNSSSKTRRPSRHESRIGPAGFVRHSPLDQEPIISDSGLKDRGARNVPEPAEKAGDRDILLVLRERPERRSGLALLEEHRALGIVGFEQSDGRIPVPNRSPSISCSASMWGSPTFNTADVPSARRAGATHEALTSGPS